MKSYKKQIRLFLLPALILGILHPLLAEKVNEPTSLKKDAKKSGFVLRIKQCIRKWYDCLIGNKETCTADEILISRFFGAYIAFIVGGIYLKKLNNARELKEQEEAERR